MIQIQNLIRISFIYFILIFCNLLYAEEDMCAKKYGGNCSNFGLPSAMVDAIQKCEKKSIEPGGCAEYQVEFLQQFDGKPSEMAEMREKFDTCSAESLCRGAGDLSAQLAAGCAWGVYDFGKETVQALSVMAAGVLSLPEKVRKKEIAKAACNASKECLRGKAQEVYRGIPTEVIGPELRRNTADRINKQVFNEVLISQTDIKRALESDPQKAAEYKEAVIEAMADVGEISYMEDRLRRFINLRDMEGPSLYRKLADGVAKAYQEYGLKWQCFNPKALTQLHCQIAAGFIPPGFAASKGAQGLKITLENTAKLKLKADEILKVMPYAGKNTQWAADVVKGLGKFTQDELLARKDYHRLALEHPRMKELGVTDISDPRFREFLESNPKELDQVRTKFEAAEKELIAQRTTAAVKRHDSIVKALTDADSGTAEFLPDAPKMTPDEYLRSLRPTHEDAFDNKASSSFLRIKKKTRLCRAWTPKPPGSGCNLTASIDNLGAGLGGWTYACADKGKLFTRAQLRTLAAAPDVSTMECITSFDIDPNKFEGEVRLVTGITSPMIDKNGLPRTSGAFQNADLHGGVAQFYIDTSQAKGARLIDKKAGQPHPGIEPNFTAYVPFREETLKPMATIVQLNRTGDPKLIALAEEQLKELERLAARTQGDAAKELASDIQGVKDNLANAKKNADDRMVRSGGPTADGVGKVVIAPAGLAGMTCSSTYSGGPEGELTPLAALPGESDTPMPATVPATAGDGEVDQ